ncbi:hypothetical protein NEOC65_000232 [Neochlamydia sp. AcF65]|nr:hypothetical protein [Neochlamydia sp. AcF65]
MTLPQVRRLINSLFCITICPFCQAIHDSSKRLFFDTS